MTETAYTKGPWNIVWRRNEQYPYPLSVLADDSGAWVARGGEVSSEANARLIAAAPDLLDALQAMYRAHHLHIFLPRGQETPADRDTCRICDGNYRNTLKHITAQEGHPSDVKAEAARLARAAIARATGEKEPGQ